jgi:DNA-directed RNA polymerase specialized sigma24 family protein
MSKLVEDNYRVLASWQDRSSFATYLSVVLVTLVRDYLSRIAIQGGPGVTVEEGKRSPAAAPLQTLLSPLLCNLTAEDRLLLKLHYREGFSIDAISRLVGTSVRELDLARGRCLKSLRHSLEEAGLGAQGIEELIGGALGELPAGQGEKLWT